MRSKTKYPISATEVRALLCAGGLCGAENIAPLGAGEFNAVFSATANGREYVAKISPAAATPVMALEKGMMAAEVFWYQQIHSHTALTAPAVVYADFSRSRLPADYFVMEKLPGAPMDKMAFSPAEKAAAAAQLAHMAAQAHRAANTRFGYVQNGLHESWYAAIHAMASAALADAAAKNAPSRRGKKLLSYIEKYRAVLHGAPCRMVNFDLWPPNILCARQPGGGLQYGLIDPERSFWGDPVADFVCLEMEKPLEQKTASLAAYNEVAEQPVHATREERLRCAVAQGYLALLMETEKHYRYTRRHFGWWRNVAASGLLYRLAFAALEQG